MRYERNFNEPVIFDLVDGFAATRKVKGVSPRPFGDLRLWLAGQIANGVRTDFPQPWEMVTVSNASGFHLFFGTVKGSDGIQRRVLQQPVRLLVQVESSFYQTPPLQELAWPMARPVVPHRLELLPGYTYPFPRETLRGGAAGLTILRGALLATDGEGIAGATIGVVGEAPTYRTDDSGQWALIFEEPLPAEGVPLPVVGAERVITLTVTSGDPPATVSIPGVTLREAMESGLPFTAMRGRVLLPNGAGSPAAVVEVAGRAGRANVKSDGRWTYHFLPQQPAVLVTVTARLPDGSSLTQDNVAVAPQQTTYVNDFQFS